ncbi:MAG: GTP cyclohydrolase I FolE2 [Nitrososphaerota archaeon]
MRRLRLPDPQSERPRVRLRINLVGVEGVTVPLLSTGGDGEVLQDVKISAFLSLPPDRRGIHASRVYEAILQLTNDRRSWRIDQMATELSVAVLERDLGCERSDVVITARLFEPTTSPVTGRAVYLTSLVRVTATSVRDGVVRPVRKVVSVRVAGVTACPCAKSVIQALTGEEGRDYTATHMQRTIAELSVSLRPEESVPLSSLTRMLRDSMSSPAYPGLKRLDEAEVVMRAVTKPVFIEDAVREVVSSIVREFGHLHPDDRVTVRMRSVESLHDYDMLAVYRGRLHEARALLGNG